MFCSAAWEVLGRSREYGHFSCHLLGERANRISLFLRAGCCSQLFAVKWDCVCTCDLVYGVLLAD